MNQNKRWPQGPPYLTINDFIVSLASDFVNHEINEG